MDDATRHAIEWECSQLVIKFFTYLDEKRYADMADLFGEGGTWVRLGTPLVGRHQILETMNEREDWMTAHVVSNIRIDIADENHASSVEYITLYRHEGWNYDKQGPAAVVLPLGILRHTDDFICIDGTWRIAKKASRAMMVDRVRVTHYERA